MKLYLLIPYTYITIYILAGIVCGSAVGSEAALNLSDAECDPNVRFGLLSGHLLENSCTLGAHEIQLSDYIV